MFGMVYEAGHVFEGQYLYVVADLATLQPPSFCDDSRAEIPPDFLSGINRYADVVKRQNRERAKQNHTAIWGGASKGVIFALFMQRAGANIEVVFDINPAKQGKYLPASGLLVHSPEKILSLLAPGANIFVMNPNYLGEVMAQAGNRYHYLTV